MAGPTILLGSDWRGDGHRKGSDRPMSIDKDTVDGIEVAQQVF